MSPGYVTLPAVSFPYNLSQNFDILNNFMGGNYSLISVNMGYSTNPEVEESILRVASYGKQLGRIEDALEVLIDHCLDGKDLAPKEKDAIFALRSLLFEIGQAKKEAIRSGE